MPCRNTYERCIPIRETETWQQLISLPRHGALAQRPFCLDALEYYSAAVCEKERQHIPLIGPSRDRRMLSLLTHVCNSDTLKALVCVACAHVHTSIRSWHKPCVRHPEAWGRAGTVRSGIQNWAVEKTICQMLRRNVSAFAGTFQLGKFKERYASDGQIGRASRRERV